MPGSSTDSLQKNVAIIGSGTGLTTAWILDNRPEFKVTVFEKNDRLGGHINSINIGGVWYEGGAEFIGHPGFYPNVQTLFQQLKVPLKEFELNMDLDDLDKREHTILPPIYHTTSSGCLPCLGGFFRNGASQQQTHIACNTLLTQFLNLLRLNNSINDAKARLTSPEHMITLEAFAEQFINEHELLAPGRREFVNEKLYPMLASAWGASVPAIKTFGAHYAMHYLEAGSQWFDAPEGLSSYIHKMADECTNTTIKLNTAILRVIPTTQDGQNGYNLLKANGMLVVDKENRPIFYDKVVMAVPTYVTQELISDLADPDMQSLVEKLKAVEYYDTTIVLHRDRSYSSRYNTVIHTRIHRENGEIKADNTMEKSWKGDILKSWVLPGEPMPKASKIETVLHYRHPYMNRAFYEAQNALHQAQNKLGLRFGGIPAGSGDSHESGITTALTQAAELCHEANCLGLNKRLESFPAIINKVLFNDLIAGCAPDSSEEFDDDIVAAPSTSNAC